MNQMNMAHVDAVVASTFDSSFSAAILEIFGVTTLNRQMVYAAFYKNYSEFVKHELGKRNKLAQNFEDLQARMWVDFSGSNTKGVGLIEKFFNQAAASAPELPPTMTGQEVADHFNISFEEWVSAQNGYISPPESGVQISGKNALRVYIEGHLAEGSSVVPFYKKVLEVLSKDGFRSRLQIPYSSSSSRFLLSNEPKHPMLEKDGVQTQAPFRTPVEHAGLFLEGHKGRPEAISHLKKALKAFGIECSDTLESSWPAPPAPVDGSPESATALYDTAEVEAWFEDFDRMRPIMNLRSGSWQVKLPPPKATKKHFLNYLKVAIGNRWANFCRYESRRHQERVWDTFSDQKSNVEDPAPWEDRQEVPSNQEGCADVALIVGRLQKTPAVNFLKEILLAVYDDGYDLQRAIQKCGMSAEEKRITIQKVCNRRTAPMRQAFAAA